MTGLQVVAAREVPLGGLRAMTVRRTLPHRDRSFVGAWCFVDHYGPTPVGADNAGGMDVPPHPHAGLATVSWLFEGEIEHRDSGGVVGLVRPGEVNLMTAGHGIAHSEVSTTAARVLHGVQLWVALPEAARDVERGFEHAAPARVALPGGAAGVGTALVFIGALTGVAASPVHTHTPLLGAQLDLSAHAEVTLPLDPTYEHGFLLDRGAVSIDGLAVQPGDLGCLDPGPRAVTLRAGAAGARLILLGGAPFEEEIVMWWNLIGRSHEEIVEQRAQWEAGADRFGSVPGYVGATERIPAPAMPTVRLRPRRRKT
ncbi:MAG: pirin family protein [Austwickia sp.]|jgi:redox-sensitive bicupin YhaK (pirin superfamily)|nr:MAG: pirin family protein [Austwickia sp.]